MAITNASGLGAAMTPEEWGEFVLTGLRQKALLLASGVTIIETDHKKVHIPRLTDDGDTAWVGPLEPISTAGPDGDDLVLTPKKVAKALDIANETIRDADVSVFKSVGAAMVRAIALAIDSALFVGMGDKEPLGILSNPEVTIQNQAGEVSYENLVRAAGKIRDEGGEPNVAYISPSDLTELQLEEGGDGRPLIQPDASEGPSMRAAGMMLFPVPALDPGVALVAEAAQIAVAVNKYPEVEFSEHAIFNQDGTVARVTARVDAGVIDPAGLCTISEGS